MPIDPSLPTSPGNLSAPLNYKDTVATGNPAGVATINPGDTIMSGVQYYKFGNTTYQNSAYQAPNVSTTTLSNANKIQQVPGIVNTTNQLSKTGITTDANGNQVFANGTIVPAPTKAEAPNPNATPNSNTSTTGGYVGDVYYAPGAMLPNGPDGKPVATTPTSPTDDQILTNINSLKAQSDSLTASLVDSIHAQFNQLRTAQQEVNRRQNSVVNNTLLMGGVTGQGSSSQYAPISSSGIMQAQISYGLGLIADLNQKEQMAVIAAKQAGLQNDFQLMDKINSQISSIRDQKVAAATKLNDTIAAQNKKLKDEKLQATKDEAISNLYASGVTDPKEILKQLNDAGMTINADEVSSTLKNIDTTAKESGIIDNIINSVIGAMGTDQVANDALIQKMAKEYGVRPEFLKNRVKGIEQQQVGELMAKYLDAGITLADSLATATAKVQKSKIYQDQIRVPSTGTKSSTSTKLVSKTDRAKYNLPPNTTQDEFDSVYNSLDQGIRDATGGKGTKALSQEDRYRLWDQAAQDLSDAGYDPKDYDALLWEYFADGGLDSYNQIVLGKEPKKTSKSSSRDINP